MVDAQLMVPRSSANHLSTISWRTLPGKDVELYSIFSLSFLRNGRFQGPTRGRKILRKSSVETIEMFQPMYNDDDMKKIKCRYAWFLHFKKVVSIEDQSRSRRTLSLTEKIKQTRQLVMENYAEQSENSLMQLECPGTQYNEFGR